VSEIEDVSNNAQVYKKLKELLYYLPNVKGILFIGGGAPGAAKVIEEMGLVGKVKLFCFDFIDEIIDLIKKGIVCKAFRQDPFGQGHDPVIYLYNYLVANQVPETNTYTRMEIIDQYSISD
jgi:methyl-accepting chemotaxis protein/ribose transport system substrate-binding protein